MRVQGVDSVVAVDLNATGLIDTTGVLDVTEVVEVAMGMLACVVDGATNALGAGVDTAEMIVLDTGAACLTSLAIAKGVGASARVRARGSEADAVVDALDRCSEEISDVETRERGGDAIA